VDRIVTQRDGAEMVYVPPGEFLMGSSDADIQLFRALFPLRDPAEYEDERPQRLAYIDGYYIDRLEVSNAQFKKFLAETGYVARGYVDTPSFNAPELPAVVLRWEDAVAYAEWAGKRLPTEAEWEKAARGTDGRIWPWGNEWDPTKLSGNDGTGAIDGYPQAAPVGSFPQGRSPYDVLDMAGNVWEWVEDWYQGDYYENAPATNPKGPDSGDGHVLRGGGWAESKDYTRCANRRGGNPGSILRGFRCAMDVP
jgi:formylglycine-generating enzyme required for sulfatase activity